MADSKDSLSGLYSWSDSRSITLEEAWADIMEQFRSLDGLLGSLRICQAERRKHLLEFPRVLRLDINPEDVVRAVAASGALCPASEVVEAALRNSSSFDGSASNSSGRNAPSNVEFNGVWQGKTGCAFREVGLSAALGVQSEKIGSALDAFAEGKLRVPGGLSMTRHPRSDCLDRSSTGGALEEAQGDDNSSSDSDDSFLDLDRDDELTRKLLQLEAQDEDDPSLNPQRWSLLSQASGLTLDIIPEDRKEDDSDSSTDDDPRRPVEPRFSSCRSSKDYTNEVGVAIVIENEIFLTPREQRFDIESNQISLHQEPAGSTEEVCLSD